MKSILLSLILLVNVNIYAQSEKIIYIVSDSVEVSIKNQVEKIKNAISNTIFYCVLSKDEGVSSISLVRYEGEQKGSKFINRLLRSTNRFLLIGNDKLPLILDYDFAFSSPDLKNIGSFGKREGEIRRSRILYHGYTIFFDSQGKITKTSNY